MALGALPAQVLQMILRESLTLVLLGVLAGVAISVGATRWIASLLFGLPANDPITYVASRCCCSVSCSRRRASPRVARR